jgi:hypothetical protein
MPEIEASSEVISAPETVDRPSDRVSCFKQTRASPVTVGKRSADTALLRRQRSSRICDGHVEVEVERWDSACD